VLLFRALLFRWTRLSTLIMQAQEELFDAEVVLMRVQSQLQEQEQNMEVLRAEVRPRLCMLGSCSSDVDVVV
jgi:hypothetical protein